jgi:hypothetical protein
MRMMSPSLWTRSRLIYTPWLSFSSCLGRHLDSRQTCKNVQSILFDTNW